MKVPGGPARIVRESSRLLVFLAAVLLSSSIAFGRSVKVGEPAPDFHATTFDGRELSLADFKGRVLLINLWATWCAPCREELPLLDAYYVLAKKHGLEVIAVATEHSVPASDLKELAAAAHIPFIRRLKGPYDILKGVPTNYVIDRNGIVRYAKAKAFTLDDLNELLVPLLQEPPPKVSSPPDQPDPPSGSPPSHEP